MPNSSWPRIPRQDTKTPSCPKNKSSQWDCTSQKTALKLERVAGRVQIEGDKHTRKQAAGPECGIMYLHNRRNCSECYVNKRSKCGSLKSFFTFNLLLIYVILWTGVTSYDGCVLSLLTDAHALCLLVPTKQVRQNIRPTLSAVTNIQEWIFKLTVIFIRLSTGAVYSVIFISGARWALHWNGWCFEPLRENRWWCVVTTLPSYPISCLYKDKFCNWVSLQYVPVTSGLWCFLYSRLDDGWKAPWWWKRLVP